VDTVEREQRHAKLAQKYFAKYGAGDRIGISVGDAVEVAPELNGEYGLIFLDVDWHTNGVLWPHIMRLLRPGGSAVLSNLWIVDEDERAGTTERQAARTLLRQLQSDQDLAYSVVTAGSPLVLVSKRG
jgi:predicted O-methyltransferase YrrM